MCYSLRIEVQKVKVHTEYMEMRKETSKLFVEVKLEIWTLQQATTLIVNRSSSINDLSIPQEAVHIFMLY